MSGLIGFAMFCSLMVFGSFSVRADEQLMNLWPNQRASHDQEMGIKAQEYQMRGQEYVDHLYATGGESSLQELDSIHDEAVDLYPMIDPVEVNIDEVANIIKSKDGQ